MEAVKISPQWTNVSTFGLEQLRQQASLVDKYSLMIKVGQSTLVEDMPDYERLMEWLAGKIPGAYERLDRFCMTSFDLPSYINSDHAQRHGRYYRPWGGAKPIIISNPEHIRELSEAPELSQRAVYSDIFGFRYNMNNVHNDWNPELQSAARSRQSSRTIKVIGVPQMAKLDPFIVRQQCRAATKMIDGQKSVGEWRTVRLAPLMRTMVSDALAIYIFGEKLCSDPDFHSALYEFYNGVLKTMGALQILPSWLAPSINRWITGNGSALDTLFSKLRTATCEEKDEWQEGTEMKEVTLLYNYLCSSKDSNYWTLETIIQALIGTWFAGAHQPWINLHFIFLELCKRPEYTEMIRLEVASQEKLDVATINQLPVLDSFMKECVRLNPLDTMAVRRKAIKPFRFSSGGPYVEPGKIACISSYNALHNPNLYLEPENFDGLRFLRSDSKGSEGTDKVLGTTLTDGSKDFPIWGLGSKMCPGRWHATHVMKRALVYLITHYEFQLVKKNERHVWHWETFQMPYEATEVMFKKIS